MKDCFLTIFTPVFNRKKLIINLYYSLKKLIDKDFEWLIVDDGSTDYLEEEIRAIQREEHDFLIRYYYQENSGKHVAINRALDLANGHMFFVVDSDDVLTEDCICIIKKWEKTIRGLNGFCGLSGIKSYPNHEFIGNTFKGEFLDITSLEQKYYNIIGDRAEVFFTEVIKKYRFPVFKDEKFLTEKVLWNQMAKDGYLLRFFNEIIYIAEYLEDGLSNNLLRNYRHSPKGYAYSILQDISYYNYNNKQKEACYYFFYNDLKGFVTLKECAKYLKISSIYLCFVILKKRCYQCSKRLTANN